MLIINTAPQGVGWYPINYMATMAARLFEAELMVARRHRRPSRARRIGAALSGRRRSGGGDETCLLICATPADLVQILEIPGWRRRFRFLAAWVIDSFWLEWIPTTMRWSLPFDHLFVTGGEDIDDWHRAVGIRPTWLPWGSDALSLGSDSRHRPWDLTRVGRQPTEWENDGATALAAEARGVAFHPRPVELATDAVTNQRALMAAYGATKFLLAFSNLASPAPYTHPTRQYLTGRWVDALSAGAVVAGCAPRGTSIDTLLWPGATLELGTTRRDEGLSVITRALGVWDGEVAHKNHALSLQRLDWRHRFATLAATFGATPPALSVELGLLQRRCAEVVEPSVRRSGS